MLYTVIMTSVTSSRSLPATRNYRLFLTHCRCNTKLSQGKTGAVINTVWRQASLGATSHDFHTPQTPAASLTYSQCKQHGARPSYTPIQHNR